jgi:iron complex outermembrane recepter protein
MESPVAITTIDARMILELAPRSTAELLKAVPGIYTESTGGEAFNNVSIRGIGTTTGFGYEMLQEDGLPVISTNNLRHGLPDQWTRESTFVTNVEALRSGTSNIFSSNAPLALINFISREGGTTQQGELTLEASSYGTRRTDLWQSGPLGKDTTYAVGAWYRVDNGARDPGFVANKGGQISANLKHSFENERGFIKFSAKALDDHNTFDLPMPLTNAASPRSIPFGPDMKKDSTSASADERILSISGTPIGQVNFDLADGIYGRMHYFGTQLDYQVADGIKLQNLNRYTSGFRSIDYAFNALPTAWQTIANNDGGRDATQFAAARDASGNYQFRLTYPGQNGAVAAANPTAAAALGNGYGNTKSWQHDHGGFNDFQNDLRLVNTLNDGKTTATAGVYYSDLSQKQFYLFNTLLTDVTPKWNRVDIMFVNATTGADIGPGTSNGLYHVGDTYRNDTSEERELSPYAVLEHKIGPFSLDAGVRHNAVRLNGTQELAANTFNLSATNPALRGSQFGTGNFVTRQSDISATAYTFGANYAVTKHFAAFARYSRGVRNANLTEFLEDMHANNPLNPRDPSRIIRTIEGGLKYATSNIGVYVTVFHADLKNIVDSQIQINPLTGLIGPTTIALQNQSTQGIELESVWTPIKGLSLGLNGTLQDPKWTDHNLKAQTLFNKTLVAFDENGKVPERTAKVVGKVMAAYRLPETSWGTVSINGSYQYTGKRFADRANSEPSPLKAFGEVQAGISVTSKSRFTARLSVNNLFNNVGLSEGDPRTGTNVLDPSVSVFLARPILPRTVTGSIGYRF